MITTDTTASEQWLLERKGKFTASEIYKLIVGAKSGGMFGVGATTYIEERACDAYTGFSEPKPMTYDMRMGKMKEPLAFTFFEKQIDKFFGFEGLRYHGEDSPLFKHYCPDSGGSPDCLAPINEDTISFGAEFKCPDQLTHMRYLRKVKDQYDLKAESEAYFGQVQFLMMIFKCDLWLWCSFHEMFPIDDRMLIIQVKPDKNYQTALDIRLKMAVKQKYQIIEELKNR
jgi:hypothetical protein